MYRRELEWLLSSDRFPNYFMLYGADEYQIELFGREILGLYTANEPNLLTFYFDEYDFSRARAHLFESSLFGGTNVLYLKSDKKIPAKELKELLRACEANGGRFLYEFYEADAKMAMDAQKLFGVNFARFFKPQSPDEAVGLLAKHSGKMGLNITKGALYSLYTIHNENLYLAASELNKLAAQSTHIDEDMVRALVYGLSEISFDDFFNKFMSARPISRELFEIMQSSGFNEIAFINSLYKSFSRLFRLHAYIKSTGKFDLKAALGYAPPQNVANLLKTQSMGLTLLKYQSIFITLNEAELKLKSSSQIDKNSLIISLILSLQSIISSKA
ncbi:DNA polymerase III subunit delta [Campylobacter sp. 19-13652]|uniref:DNA polymerase III subunit delta n=1 Tax=Campylobacter sp. 19-13652 TaxID=2840180 RepID=UPI001C76E06F|nr:DNA polymerase III subunit delta [Campylobacter sp. 19-13652]BCX79502.1 DNA polymerase III subunit delta [Campylobacter sp. 19-13652]